MNNLLSLQANLTTVHQMTSKDLRKEFFELFEKEYASSPNRIEAYDKAESVFMSKYNHRMYANFPAFNVSHYRCSANKLKNSKRVN